MKHWKLRIILIAACFIQGMLSKEILLTTSKDKAVINKNFTFTCTFNEYSKVRNSRWEVWENFLPSITRYDNGSCLGAGIFSNKNRYEIGCPSPVSFTVTILRVQLIDHNKKWKCYDWELSDITTVFVKVPVTNVTVYPPTGKYMKEHHRQSIKCNTSASRPQPNVNWYLNSPNNLTRKFSIAVNLTQTNTTDANGLVSVENSLHFFPNRSINSWMLYCEAWTDTLNTAVQSRKLVLKISYPPDSPPIIHGYENNKIYRLIESEQGKLSCSITGGNPLATLNWNCYNRKSPIKTTVNDTVITNVTWEAVRNQTSCSCESDHTFDGKHTTNVTIDVMYPPTKPLFTISSKNVTGVVKIIESKQMRVACESRSNPKPNYTWNGPDISNKTEQTLTISSIYRHNEGKYECTAKNKMVKSDETYKQGRSTSSINVKVLYPPRQLKVTYGKLERQLIKQTSINVIKGDTFSLYCDAIGYPNPDIIWENFPSGRVLNISTIPEDVNITCKATNRMIETVGESRTVSIASTLSITVLFPAQITVFSEFENKSKEVIVVNETEIVSLNCTAEANPASNMTIRSPQNEEIAAVSNKNVLLHTLQNTSYVDAGEYICTGRNNYTDDQESRSKLILIVRCPPKLSSDNTKDGKVATLLHTNVTLQFTARDYLDEPNKTMFTWFKENATIEEDNSKFVISSHGLQSNLSIAIITQTDLGKYRVRVSNSVGQYIHVYELLVKDKPETPKNFAYINDSVTDSSVTLKWMPGFCGGYPQNFFLVYKRNTGRHWQNKSIKDTGDNEMNYTLVDLFSMTDYQVKMFARNTEGDSASTESLQFTTKAPVVTPVESHPPSMIGIVVGSVSSSIIVLTIAGVVVLVLIYRKRKNKENGSVYQNIPFSGNHVSVKRKRESLETEETLFEGLQDVDDVPIITNERTEYCNSPEIIETIDRIKVTELFSYVSDRSEESFEADYQKLPTELQKPCTFARKPENIALNRYNGIYPYDDSRVKLHGEPDFFINACYIDGYKINKAYIASLGPTAKTTSDFKTFWKMIWSERVDVIVMLTNLREPSGMKCEKYWPEGGATIWYGDVCVSNAVTECFAEYTIRQFSVSKDEERRSLTHLHYTAWPDKTVPEDVTSLIEVRQKMKTTPTTSEGPVVVHCSAGIGRTGTLIALDRLIEEGQDKGSLNVFECVKNMREQRVKMVQTFEQYMYIYKALVNALTLDCETIPVETFNEHVDATKSNMYSLMFQQLGQSVETERKADVETRLKNEKLTNKNRRGADIPGHRFRAMLYLNRTDEGSEYINAVYINSFVKKDFFIGAQSPLQCTVADFITLVYQEDCSCIATMEDLKDPGMTVGQYLPDDKKTLTVGDFKVSSSTLETKHNYVVREMKIKYSGKIESGEKTVYHFQYTKWMTGHDTPVDSIEFVQFVNEVKEYANELGEERSHVLVHCLKANERSGLFCALAILMEKIKFERQVNVLNTLRHLRTRRQTAITSVEQLKFCYQATSAYIKMIKLG